MNSKVKKASSGLKVLTSGSFCLVRIKSFVLERCKEGMPVVFLETNLPVNKFSAAFSSFGTQSNNKQLR